MKAYIHHSVSISRLSSFEKGILASIDSAITNETQHPDYKEYISPALIRRMSPVVKMAVACGLQCARKEVDWAGIIVGTGLGCLRDTEVFLKTVLKKDGLAISPTAFIQSTHNTIAGQLALATGNKGYNMTHSQQEISFECALNDAILLTNESKKEVLVGAAEEHIPFLIELGKSFGSDTTMLSEGVSFFNLSPTEKGALAQVELVQFLEHETELKKFVEKEKPDLIMYRNGFTPAPNIEYHTPSINFQKYCGIYSTNSAFGLQLACELLSHKEGVFEKIPLADLNKIMLVNFYRGKIAVFAVTQP